MLPKCFALLLPVLLLAPQVHGCAFSNSTVCDYCEHASADSCAQEATAHCKRVNWTDAPCSSLRTRCPFQSSQPNAPLSPCEHQSCVGVSADVNNCTKVVESYCSYHLVHSALFPNYFVMDSACAGFGAVGCQVGQVRDCDNKCVTPSGVGNGVCDQSSSNNLNCAAFEFDGGDCGACGFGNTDVCTRCSSGNEANCTQAITHYCQMTSWSRPACAQYRASCPFSTNDESSPCLSQRCVGNDANITECVGVIEEYCTAQIIQQRTIPSFTPDAACAGFGSPGCASGELRDCNNQCSNANSLGDSHCDTKWQCLDNDAADCDGCEFSNRTVCLLCHTEGEGCAGAVVEHCKKSSWTETACANLLTGCPFNGTGAGPTSPCYIPACVLNGSRNITTCASGIEQYCTYQLAHRALSSSFVVDPACASFGAIGCSSGYIRDCDRKCASLTTLHNGVCESSQASTSSPNWMCADFSNDGGDCGAASSSPSISVSRSKTASPSPSPSSIRSRVQGSASLSGITADDFKKPEVTNAFKDTVAQRAGVTSDDVVVTGVSDSGNKATQVTVDFFILVAETATPEQIESAATAVQDTQTLQTNLNTAFQQANIPLVVTGVQVTTIVIAIPSPTTSPTVSPSASTSEESDDSSSSNNDAAIIGGTVGGIGGAIAIIAALVLCKRRKYLDGSTVNTAFTRTATGNSLPVAQATVELASPSKPVP